MPDGYVAGSNGKWCNRACNKCGKMGHTYKFCPNEGTSNMRFIFSTYAFADSIDGLDILDGILLLDTAATNTTTNRMNVCLEGLVHKCPADDILYARTNGGLSVFNEKGMLSALPMTAHFNPNSLTTILSFKEVYD